MPVKNKKETSATVRSTVNIESCLLKLRNLCREHGLQIWDKQSLSDQIYQDLLFIWHIPRLIREGILNLDAVHIGGDKMSEVSYSGLLSLKEEKLIAGAFKALWRSLQRSEVSAFFDGREFSMFSIEKKDNKADKYFKLLKAIVEYFSSIDLAAYDSNAGYTYFKKDLNKGTATTFGQFYTPKPVLHSVIQEVKPQPGEKILDPSSGSCSFIQETAVELMRKFNLSPKEAFANLFGVEIEQNIYQEGAINIFLNFGLLPNMADNIREGDSFHLLLEDETKYHKIVANPPFGADASSFFGKYFKEEMVTKGKRVVKVRSENPEVKVKIPFTQTKESAILFFQIIIQKLMDGGKAGVVMSSTILNDSFKDMMKWFLECCSLEKIIINPAGTFKDQGTGIETFSFIFTKGSPTTKVNIVMLGAEGDVVRSLTIEQIKEAGWKLQLKEDNKVAYTGEYETIPFDQMINGKNGKNIPEEKRLENGQYPYYASNGVKGSVDEFNFEGPSVLIGDQGSSWTKSVHYVGTGQKFFAGNHTIVIKASAETCIRYIYYLLSLSNLSVFGKESSIIPEMNKDLFYKSHQSKAPLPIQQEIVTTLDRIFADPQDMKDCLAFTDKAMDLMLKDPSGKLLEDVMIGLRMKRSHLASAASIKTQMAAVMRSVGARGYEKKKVGDCVNMNPENVSKHDTYTIIDYIDLSCVNEGVLSQPQQFTFSERPGRAMRKVQAGDILWGTVRPLSRSYTFLDTVNDKTIVSTGFVVVRNKEERIISSKFLYYLLTTDECVKYLSDNSGGSSYPAFKTESLSEYSIPIPPLPVQKEILAILNEMEAEMKAFEQMAEKSVQRTKYILDGYLKSYED